MHYEPLVEMSSTLLACSFKVNLSKSQFNKIAEASSVRWHSKAATEPGTEQGTSRLDVSIGQ